MTMKITKFYGNVFDNKHDIEVRCEKFPKEDGGNCVTLLQANGNGLSIAVADAKKMARAILKGKYIKYNHE